MKNKKEARVRRRISGAGLILLSYLAVGAIWPVDAAVRTFRNQRVDLYSGDCIIADGEFVDSVKTEGTIVLEKETEVSAEPDDNFTEQTTELVINEASTGLKNTYVPSNCVTVPQEAKDVKSGKLLQLDSRNGYSGKTGDLVTFAEKNDSYRMKNMDLQAKSEVVEAMNKMAAAYETVMERADLMVYSTTAPYCVEGSLYPEELPDRATGYCIDLCILNEDGTIEKIKEDSPWLTNNAHLYGFVRSYTQADSEVTGIESAPYHLRYVGKVHAAIMHEEGLTLNDYFEEMRSHTTSDPYYWTDGNTTWSVYYVPATIGGTEVPVPLNPNYEISGNNTDGFIVTAEGKIGD